MGFNPIVSFGENLWKSICDWPGRVWNGCTTGWNKMCEGFDQMGKGAGFAGLVTAFEGSVKMVTGGWLGADSALDEAVDMTCTKVTDELGNVSYINKGQYGWFLDGIASMRGVSKADDENAQATINKAIETGDFSEANKVMGFRMAEHVFDAVTTVATCGVGTAVVKGAGGLVKAGATAVKASTVGAKVASVGAKVAGVAGKAGAAIKATTVGAKVASAGAKIASAGAKVASVASKAGSSLKAVGTAVKTTVQGSKAVQAVTTAIKSSKAIGLAKTVASSKPATFAKAAVAGLAFPAKGYVDAMGKQTMLDYQVDQAISSNINELVSSGQLSEANKEKYAQVLSQFYATESVLGSGQVGFASADDIKVAATANGLLKDSNGEDVSVDSTVQLYDSYMAGYQEAVDAGYISKDQAGQMASLSVLNAVGQIDERSYLSSLYAVQFQNYDMTDEQIAMLSVLNAQRDMGEITEDVYNEALFTEPMFADFVTEDSFEIPLKPTEAEIKMMQKEQEKAEKNQICDDLMAKACRNLGIELPDRFVKAQQQNDLSSATVSYDVDKTDSKSDSKDSKSDFQDSKSDSQDSKSDPKPEFDAAYALSL